MKSTKKWRKYFQCSYITAIGTFYADHRECFIVFDFLSPTLIHAKCIVYHLVLKIVSSTMRLHVNSWRRPYDRLNPRVVDLPWSSRSAAIITWWIIDITVGTLRILRRPKKSIEIAILANGNCEDWSLTISSNNNGEPDGNWLRVIRFGSAYTILAIGRKLRN